MEAHISMCHGMVALLLMMLCLSRIEARMQATMQQLEVQEYLERLNKPAIKSIMSPDGDIIDCVHINHQPALDHPLLKNHTIQMRPAFHPIGLHDENKVASKKKKTSSVAQLWHQNGTCPEDTIPVRRIRKDDVLRASSVERYGKKRHNTVPNPTSILSVPSDQQEHAYGYVSGGKYLGTNLFLDIWNPYVQGPEEFSSAQLWLIGNPSGDSDVIEAGWHVYPSLYGDSKTRFFISWTSDNFKKTGCYNLVCFGFVQTSNKVALGSTLSPISGNDGSRHGFNLLIWKEQSTKNWWLKFEDEVLGYWPSFLFNDLSESASAIEWGGVIANSKPNGQHTSTVMGSGRFAESNDASRCSSIQIVDESNNLQEPTGITTAAQSPNYYNVGQAYFHDDIGTYFLYGGPGNSNPHPS